MSPIQQSLPLRRSLPVIVLLVALGLVLPAAATAACAGAPEAPGPAARAITLCLLNAERAGRGLRPLRSQRALALAASRHAGDMVARAYFSHSSPTGVDVVGRIRRTGYLRARRTWRLGENIAWGSGAQASPAAVVAGWMQSPPHRANVLSKRFREVGIGIAGGAGGTTFVTDFGYRRR